MSDLLWMIPFAGFVGFTLGFLLGRCERSMIRWRKFFQAITRMEED